MDLTAEQIEQATAGKPVRIEIAGRGVFFLVNVRFFEKIASGSAGSDPELAAFLDLAEEQAERISSENPY